jgi:hypothetical protein
MARDRGQTRTSEDIQNGTLAAEKINMLYMVIEHFHDGAAPEVYKRFREQGRMMPDSLKYIASWIEPNFERCFQLMEWEDRSAFDEWASKWNDLMELRSYPVLTSAEVQATMIGAI